MELTDRNLPLPQHKALSSVAWKGQWTGILGLCGLLAFSWIPNSYYTMVSWPWIGIWQVAFLMLGVWNIRVIRQFSIPYRLLGYGLDWVVGVALLSSIVSALNADFTTVAFWNVLLFGNYVIALYLLVNWLRQGLPRQYLLVALCAAGTITSIVGLSLWEPSVEMWQSNNFYTALRNSWPLGHHNFVGGYELLILPLVASFCFSQQGWKRWLWVATTSIVAIAFYVSGSRGALVGGLAILIIGIPTQLWLNRGKSQQRILIISIIALAIGLSVVMSNPRMREIVNITPSPEANQASLAVISDGPTRDRIFMLQAAQDIFKTHPIIGVGPGNLSRVYNLYRPLEVGNGLELVQQLHNTPAQFLAEIGILGIACYTAWLLTVARISVNLHHKISQNTDRYLLLGITASYLGYNVSSLTDYQLENIGISSTLLIITALLINLGDTYIESPSTPKALSHQSRRLASLGVLTFLCASLQIWCRADAALYLAGTALENIQENNLVQADAKLSKASFLAPWDPTYPAIAAEQLISIKDKTTHEKDKAALTKEAISYLESALKVAPNDTWLNQNLAVLLIESNQPKAAEVYAKRAAMLFPRNSNYTYYTLGTSYLQQNKIDQAIEAFSLESLANPIFLTSDIWATEPFADILPTVIDKTLNSYREVISQTSATSLHYQWANEQLAILSWWYQRPTDSIQIEQLRPIIQALLASSNDIQKAVSIVEQQIELGNEDSNLKLLQTWLSPNKYLDSYLEDFKGTNEEKNLLKKHITGNRDIHQWMKSVLKVTSPRLRNGVGFAYRNLYANYIRKILHPRELRVSFFGDLINLFQEAPVVFPQLDQHMATVKAEKLSLTPIHNTHFKSHQS